MGARFNHHEPPLHRLRHVNARLVFDICQLRDKDKGKVDDEKAFLSSVGAGVYRARHLGSHAEHVARPSSSTQAERIR